MPGRRRGISYGIALAAVALGLVALLPSAARAFPGEQVWVAEYDGGVVNGFDLADAVAVSSDGTRVYVTGQSQAANGLSDYATVAYAAATGTQAWVARYEGGYDDSAKSIAVSRDGTRVFVTGTSDNELGGPDSDYATAAYDRTGRQLWVRRDGGPGREYPFALAVSPDGSRVFVTGASEGQGTSRDYLTIAYDATSGARLWVRRYDGPASGAGDGDRAVALAVSPDGGRVYVTGDSESSVTSFDYATLAYDAATGTKLWLRRYDGPAHQAEFASALALNRAGTRLYVTGESDAVANNCVNCEPDYATVGYRADTGTKLWASRFGRTRAQDRAKAIGVSPKGFVVVTGESRHQYGYDYATVAYTTGTGATVWSKRYDFAGRADTPWSLGVSPDGARVYITGESLGTDGYADAATLAYDTATGSRAWLSRYDAGSQDRGLALAVAPDGKHVFVAGDTVGDPGWVYLTVSYAG